MDKKVAGKKLGPAELMAIMAIAGVATAGMTTPANAESSKHSLHAVDKTNLAGDSGKESACGKGSCGTDESGAKAAQEKHAAEAKKDKNDKTAKKTTKKPESKNSPK